jgi:hypothetical protein
MKTRTFTTIIILSALLGGIARADRTLERTELVQVFQQLTASPHRTWISAGTIEAKHEEYKAAAVTDGNEINRWIITEVKRCRDAASEQELTEEMQKMKLDATPFNTRYELSNEYTMVSKILVKYDGRRFYWETDINSRTDSVTPGKELTDNYMTQQFDLESNKKRIFAWDGTKYTTYFLPVNNAIINEGDNKSHSVHGPLTAGIIPWGHGKYTYENLCADESTGVETIVNGEMQIIITIKETNGSVTNITLDADKNYAVINCLTQKSDGSAISREYSDYIFVSNNWVPKNILIEQFEAGTNRLIARDIWNVANINETVPGDGDFDVNYEPDALIEHFAGDNKRSSIYRHSNATDTKKLLKKHLETAETATVTASNCATTAIRYTASELGVEMSSEELATLVNQNTGMANLYDMEYFLRGFGLYCRAVKTDIETLKKMNGCKVILYFAGKKHFVVVDHIDNRYIWTADLAKPRFYDRTEISFFDMDWTDGTALLVSKQSISGDFNDIRSDGLGSIIGGAGYSCGRVYQQYHITPCVQGGDSCTGKYYEYFDRYGCQAAESGSCSNTKMTRYRTSPCTQQGEMCDYDAQDWTYYSMLACK